MNREYIHDAFSSFVLWFDHKLLANHCYNTVGTQLFPSIDPNLSGYGIYASPLQQWVYDSSIPDLVVPSGVYVNNSFVNRGVSGLALDFQRGRAIFDTPINGAIVSGNYTSREFNIYPTNKSDQELIFETSYVVNPSSTEIYSGLPPNKIVAPCVFLKTKGYSNKPFAFGGLDMTTTIMQVIAVTKNESDLAGIAGICMDSYQDYIPILFGSNYTPINRYGDLKSGYYNYEELISTVPAGQLGYVSLTNYTKLNQRATYVKYPDMHIGFMDIRIELPRYAT